MKAARIWVATVAATLIILSAIVGQAQVTAIKAGRLVDPAAGETALNRIVLIEGEKITAVGPELQIPAGARVIDLSNATVLPGLFDAHTHMCQMTSPENRDLFTTDIRQPDTYRAILVVVNARAMLESGFTTIRDVGNNGNYAWPAILESFHLMKRCMVTRWPLRHREIGK